MNTAKAMRLKQKADEMHATLLRKADELRAAQGHLSVARRGLDDEAMRSLMRPVRQTEIREDGRAHEFTGPSWKEIKRRQRAIDAAERDLRRIQSERDELLERWRRAAALVAAITETVGERALKPFAHQRGSTQTTNWGNSGVTAGNGPMINGG
ncbi:hypothetical protein [Oceanibaculum indicum]|uniref:Uncharacterized protein n=1 Tax=Oceanibaculum indicum TaxID=526216 RepID=A0A420WRL6_9PROT|nr:hypothetical protein [Oceanibaculum indicum]RKQ73486.1 hypothetical protein BCL74_1275 [Oceanibaculum indicum]